MLPLKNIQVAIPNEIIATSIKILEIVQEDMPLKYDIFPAQPPQKIGYGINKPTNFNNNELEYQSG